MSEYDFSDAVDPFQDAVNPFGEEETSKGEKIPDTLKNRALGAIKATVRSRVGLDNAWLTDPDNDDPSLINKAARKLYEYRRNALGSIFDAAGSVVKFPAAYSRAMEASTAENEIKRRDALGLEPLESLEPENRRKMSEVTDSLFWGAGDFIKSIGNPDRLPFENPESFDNQLASGAGYMAAFMASGGPVGAAAIGSAVGGTHGVEDALEHDAGEEETIKSFLMNSGLGTTEAIPISRFFSKIRVPGEGGIAGIIKEGAVESLEELIQETIQSAGANAIAKALYAQDRELLEGVKEGAQVGGTLGFVMGLMAEALGRRSKRFAAPQETLDEIDVQNDDIDNEIAKAEKDYENTMRRGGGSEEASRFEELLAGLNQAKEQNEGDREAALAEIVDAAETPLGEDIPYNPDPVRAYLKMISEQQEAGNDPGPMMEGVDFEEQQVSGLDIAPRETEMEGIPYTPSGNKADQLAKGFEERVSQYSKEKREALLPEGLKDNRLLRDDYRNRLKDYSKAAESLPSRRSALNPGTDDLLAAIRKSGGISREAAKAEGIDPSLFTDPNFRGVFKADGGDTFDGMAENLSQHGYGTETANQLLDMVTASVNQGEQYFSSARSDESIAGLSDSIYSLVRSNETKMEPKGLANAVNKALNGERLTEKQSRAVSVLVDNIRDERAAMAEPEVIERYNRWEELHQQRVDAGEVYATKPEELRILIPEDFLTEETNEVERDLISLHGLAFGRGVNSDLLDDIMRKSRNEQDAARAIERELKRHEEKLRSGKSDQARDSLGQNDTGFEEPAGLDDSEGQLYEGPTSEEELDSIFGADTRPVDQQANEAATSPTNNLPEPTEAQKEAGNYKLGHINVQGLDVSIENPKGSIRRGTDPDGNAWESEMANHYGYIRRTEGADGEPVDVFVGDNIESDRVFIIDQGNPDGTFDEHKVMIGFDSEQEAVEAYKSNYDDGWTVGPVTALPMDAFKEWLKSDKTKEAFESKPDSRAEEAVAKKPVKSDAPEHQNLTQGVSKADLDRMVADFAKYQKGMMDGEDKVTHVFDPPKKDEIVRLNNKVKKYVGNGNWMTKEEADAEIKKWADNATAQGRRNADTKQMKPNESKVVLSLFDLSGAWAEPWYAAGYEVWTFDIQDSIEVGDINNFSTQFFSDYFGAFEGKEVHAILAACPCTDFAVSGARHFAAKDEDGRTAASVQLVRQTLATIEYFKPSVWAIENPVGRIEKMGGLPPWRMSFDPFHFGEDYTKKTLLWGRFNGDLPIAPTEPTEGSKMHKKYGGKSVATKNARSVTPEGFAYAFFDANNAIDHPVMTMSNRYDRLDKDLMRKAIESGATEEQIDDAVMDFYYFDQDDRSANLALKDLAEGTEAEYYQWMRNEEGGQSYGNTQRITRLTPELFAEHIRPKLRKGYADTFEEYIDKNPDDTHINLVFVSGKGEQAGTPATGSVEDLRPKSGLEKGWAIKVDDLGSEEARAHGSKADSENSSPGDDAVSSREYRALDKRVSNLESEKSPESIKLKAASIRRAVTGALEKGDIAQEQFDGLISRVDRMTGRAPADDSGQTSIFDAPAQEQADDRKASEVIAEREKKKPKSLSDKEVSNLAKLFFRRRQEYEISELGNLVFFKGEELAEYTQAFADGVNYIHGNENKDKQVPTTYGTGYFAGKGLRWKLESGYSYKDILDHYSLNESDLKKPAPAPALEVPDELPAQESVEAAQNTVKRMLERKVDNLKFVSAKKYADSLLSPLGIKTPNSKKALVDAVSNFEEIYPLNAVTAFKLEISESIRKILEKDMAGRQANSSADVDADSATPGATPVASTNKIVTDEKAEEARRKLRAALSGTKLNSGLDPELMNAGVTLATYHIEKGSRRFIDFSRAMIADIGDGIRPYLRQLYEMVRYAPELSGSDIINQLDDSATIDALERSGALSELTKTNSGANNERSSETVRDEQDSAGQPDGALGGVQPGNVQSDGRTENPESRDGQSVSSDNSGNDAAGQSGNDDRGSLGDGTRDLFADPRSEPGAGREEPATGPSGRSDSGNQSTNASKLVPSGATPAPIKGADYFTISPDDLVGAGGLKTKFKNNVAAIRLLRELDETGRVASREEQSILAKYVGWGGMPQAFKRPDGTIANGWEKEAGELESLLTSEEIDAAKRSTQDAHYTSTEIVQGIWEGLNRLGFKGGKVLEPSVGVGNFYGLMPDSVRKPSTLHGVELDVLTGKIATHLYPKAKIQTPMGFQDYGITEPVFDIAVGNPPFGSQKIYDRNNKEISSFSIHNYFFAKSIDALKPNGVLAMVVSNSFMDASSNRARAYIADKAELLGAIRMPNNAFSSNANTEVTTDIIFLRKLPPGETANKDWVDISSTTDKEGRDVPLNNYFIDNPDMMLGEWGLYGSMYRGDMPALVARDGQNTGELLANAIARLPSDVMQQSADATAENTGSQQGVESVWVNSMFLTPSGDVHVRLPDSLGEAQSEAVDLKGKALSRVVGMIKIRDAFKKLAKQQLSSTATDAEIEKSRSDLNRAYDSFVKTNGPVNTDANKRVFREDPSWPQVSALEDGFDKGISLAMAKKTGEKVKNPSAQKAPIFSKRTQYPPVTAKSFSSAKDALTGSLLEHGAINLEYMSDLYGKSDSDIVEELGTLVFEASPGEYVTREEFLSGNVKKKLADARKLAEQDARFLANVEALEAVIPEDIEAVDISVQLGAHWIPSKVVEDFGSHVLQSENVSASYMAVNSSWVVRVGSDVPSSAQARWSTHRATAQYILERAINGKQPQIYDQNPDKTRTLNQDATNAAKQKAEEMKAEFQRWVWTDDARRENLSRIYNDTFNTTVLREFDGSHLQFPGKVSDDVIKLRPHQANAVWRISQSDVTLLDHVVGAGKTFTMVAGAMEMRRIGRANKPLFIVPNHLVGQWAADFTRLYPNANVLATTKKDFERANRQRLFSRIATGDWDAVIMAHSSFGKLATDPWFVEKLIKEQIAEYETAIEQIRAQDGKKSRTLKNAEKAKERLTEKLERLSEGGDKDEFMHFSETGVDALFLDEAHEFKNLPYVTGMQVGSLGNPQGSQKAADLFNKVRFIKEQNGGRNIVFATGTPISNSMAELYNMQRYLDYETMQEQGVTYFDAWARQFGEVVTDWELSPAGKYKLNSRFAKFVNVPEIIQRYRTFSDVINRDDINRMLAVQGKSLPVPKLKTGKPINLVVDRSQEQASYIGMPIKDEQGNDTEIYPKGTLIWRSENIPKKLEKGADNMLKIMSDARKAALDMRLLGGSDYDGSKANRSVTEIKRIYDKWSADKGAQLVFIDLSTPKTGSNREKTKLLQLINKADEGDPVAAEALDKMNPDEMDAVLNSDNFSVYDDMRSKLIDAGIPENEIEFIHSANTDLQKEELFGKVRSGKIRVLFGSTSKMGAGMNVQERLVALHHIDAPWRPSDLEQREGRIIRQGNALYDKDPENFEIEVLRYATKNTLDSRMWQTLELKARFIEQFRAGDVSTRTVEDISGEAANSAEMKAASSGNPLILEEMDLRKQIREIEGLEVSHNRQQHRVRDDVRRYEQMLESRESDIEAYEQDLAKANAVPKDFSMTVAGKSFTKRVDAGKALQVELAKVHKDKNKLMGESVKIGEYAGFEIHAEPRAIGNHIVVDVIGAKNYDFMVEDYTKLDHAGLSTRVTNRVSDIANRYQNRLESFKEAEQQLPQLREALEPFGQAEELEELRRRHAAVIEALRPKKKENQGEGNQATTEGSQDSSPVAQPESRATQPETPVSQPEAPTRTEVPQPERAPLVSDPEPAQPSVADPAPADTDTQADAVQIEDMTFVPMDSVHTKTGNPLFVLNLKSGDMGDNYDFLNSLARRNGGSYIRARMRSYYKDMQGNKPDGTPTFTFKTKEGRDKFLSQASVGGGGSGGIVGSRAPVQATSNGLNKLKAQEVVSQFFKRYKGAANVEVRIYRTEQEAISAEGEGMRGLTAGYQLERDRLLIVSGRIRTPKDLIKVLQHEILVHKGLGFFSPEDRAKLLEQVKSAIQTDATLFEQWADVFDRYEDVGETEQAEELLAKIAEEEITVPRKIWNAIALAWRDLLRKAGWIKGNPTSRADLQRVVYDIGRAFEIGATIRRDARVDDAAAYSREVGTRESDKDRLARAEQMGFDTETVYYHGGAKPDSYYENTFFTKDREIAEIYASEKQGIYDGEEGVNEVYLAMNNTATEEDVQQAALDAGIDEYEVRTNDPYFIVSGYIPEIDSKAIIENLKSKGFDSAHFPNDGDFGGGTSESWLVFDPSNIRSVNAAFDPDKADQPYILASRQDNEGFSVRDETKQDLVIRKAQDKFRRLKVIQEAIRESGGSLPDDANPYMAEEAVHGKVEEDMRHLAEDFVEPLSDVIGSQDLENNILDLYLIALHAKERNAHIAEINEGLPDGGSGMTNKQAEYVIQKVESSENAHGYRYAAGLVHDMLSQTRKQLQEEGLITDEQYESWEEGYTAYVPLKGFASNEKGTPSSRVGKGFRIAGNESLRALGRTSLPESPMSHAIRDSMESIVRARKNQVGQAFLKMAVENPNADMWEVFTEINPDMKRVEVGGKVKMAPMTAGDMRSARDGDLPKYFVTKIEGHEIYIKINDQLLNTAMHNMGVDQMEGLLRGLSRVNRFLSSVNTSLNPEFVVTNFSRDIQTALYNVTAEAEIGDSKTDQKKIAGAMVRDVPKALKAVFKGQRNMITDPEWGQYYDEFRADGAKTGFFDSPDIKTIQKRMERLATEAKGGAKGKAFKAGKYTLKVIEDINLSVENAVRLSAYVNARKAGVNRVRAASLAKNLTVNFNRKGEWGNTMNALYLFYNAAIQGNAQFVRSLFSKPVDGKYTTTAQKIALGSVAFASVLAMINRAMSEDDDDGVSYYDKIPSHVRERNMIFMFPGNEEGRYAKVPLPYGYNIFHVTGTILNDLATDSRPPMELANEWVFTVLGSFNPVGMSQSEDLFVGLAKTAMPTLGTPAIEIMANEGFYGQPIHPSRRFNSIDPDSSMAYSSTTDASQVVAAWLNSLSGGNSKVPGYLDIYPDSLDHWFDFFTGGSGRFIRRGYGVAKDYAETGSVEEHEIPFWRLVTGTNSNSSDTQKFYDRLNLIKQHNNAYEELSGDGRRVYREQFGGWLSADNIAKKYENDVRDLRRKYNEIRANENLTERERKERMDKVSEQIDLKIDQFNTRVEERLNAQ